MIPTDFPEPVVPATSRWGIFSKLTTTALPAISFPRARDKCDFEFSKAEDARISFNRTIFLFVFGISMPTTDLPSITSTTLTLLTARDLAISWAMFVILFAFVPGAGWISNLVTTGPGKTETTSASIPNSSNLISSSSDRDSKSALLRDSPSSNALSKSSVLGIFVIGSLSWSMSDWDKLTFSSVFSFFRFITLWVLGTVFISGDFLGKSLVVFFFNDSVCLFLIFFIELLRVSKAAKKSFSKNLKTFSIISFANENILISNLPAKEKSNGHEIFKPRVVEGIKNINKNNRVPIKPKIKTKFEKINLPIKPPDDPWGKNSPAI